MTTEKMQIKVSLAWWLTPYLCGVAFMCAFTGREYDEDKVKRVINRALRFKVQA